MKRIPLSEEQAPAIWQNAPERGRRALMTVFRAAVVEAEKRLKAEQEQQKDGDRSE